MLIEQTAQWGGRAPVDGGEIAGKPVDNYVDETVAALEAMDNVTLRRRMMGAGVYDHGYVLSYERLTDHAPEMDGPRHRLWRIRAGHIVTATGAIERPLSFAGNDIPGDPGCAGVAHRQRADGAGQGVGHPGADGAWCLDRHGRQARDRCCRVFTSGRRFHPGNNSM